MRRIKKCILCIGLVLSLAGISVVNVQAVSKEWAAGRIDTRIMAEEAAGQIGTRIMAEEAIPVEQEPFVQTDALVESQLYAQSAVLMDAASGRVLYEKNGNEVLSMASTTKIVTCIVALENADLDETVSISAYAASMPKVKLYVKKGEQYKLGDLLYSLMLESHNDVAVAIAEHVGQSFLEQELREKDVSDFTREESEKAVAAFADLMNEKAAQLGCENTWFITPNGLDATETFHGKDGSEWTKKHSTTATELAILMSYCVLHSPKKETFLQITRTPSYTVTSLGGRNSFCTNHNAFLNMMDGVLSGKTGFTNQAGYCYTGALERDGRTYVVALLACGWPNNKSYKWSDSKKLFTYGTENFVYQSFAEADGQIHIPKALPVLDAQTPYIGQEAYVPIVRVPAEPEGNISFAQDGIPGGDMSAEPEGNVSFTQNSVPVGSVFGEPEGILLAVDEQIEVRYEVLKELTAPVKKGDVVGTIIYEVNGIIYKREDVVTTAGIEKIDLKWCMEQVFSGFF